MKDWRGTEIVVGSLVAVIENNRVDGVGGTHMACGEIVRLAAKRPIVRITERSQEQRNWRGYFPPSDTVPRALAREKVTVIGHVAPKAFEAVVWSKDD